MLLNFLNSPNASVVKLKMHSSAASGTINSARMQPVGTFERNNILSKPKYLWLKKGTVNHGFQGICIDDHGFLNKSACRHKSCISQESEFLKRP